MAELEEKIKNLLESPDGMNQILKTAQTLFGSGIAQDNAETADKISDEVSELVPTSAIGDSEMNLLDSIDPQVVTTAMQIMNEYRRADDRRIKLLNAMRSYFKDEDQVHITKAIQIVKLSKVAKQAFRSMREEDTFV